MGTDNSIPPLEDVVVVDAPHREEPPEDAHVPVIEKEIHTHKRVFLMGLLLLTNQDYILS